jgi:hypothetical protein
MEMYTSKEKNTWRHVCHYIDRAVDAIRIRARSILHTGVRRDHRVKARTEWQAESAKRYYEAQAAGLQYSRYFR